MHPLLLLVLSPLLLLQGVYVRKVTPRLPEPTGARAGETGAGQALSVLILGDSAAAGVGAETQQQALAGQLVKRLEGSHALRWQLWAANGCTSARCLALLEERAAETFDVVLVSLGVNDVTGGVAVDEWLRQQDRMAELLRGKFGARRILFTALPPMHRFPALPQPLRWALGARAKRFNRALQAFVADRGDCRLLALDLPTRAEFIAADGFHPSALAYGLWAERAASCIAPDGIHRQEADA